MTGIVLVCGKVFDGISDALTGPAEILIEDSRISNRPIGPPHRPALRSSTSPMDGKPRLHRHPRASHDGCQQFGGTDARFIRCQGA